MTQLLISVTSVEEAQLALENGVDIIDLKDPYSGALGALPLSLVKTIVQHIHASELCKPISATIGDIPMQPELILERINLLANAKVDFIKIGFFEAEDYQACLTRLSLAATSTHLIAVLFAEYLYPPTMIEDIKRAGFKGLMLDTVHKNGQTLLYYHTRQFYENLANQVISYGMTFGLAGSLKLQDIEKIIQFKPTYIGFRGGVCMQFSRKKALDIEKIKAIRHVLECLL